MTSFFPRFWLSALLVQIAFAIGVWFLCPQYIGSFAQGCLLGACFWVSAQIRTLTMVSAVRYSRYQKLFTMMMPLLGLAGMAGLSFCIAKAAFGNALQLGVVILGFFSYNCTVLSELGFSLGKS